jgi:hypothetical protein
MQSSMYLGKMTFAKFYQLGQALGEPIIEGKEHIGDNVYSVHYIYLSDTSNRIYYKCDNVRLWMNAPLPDNVQRALDYASTIGEVELIK